jgi:transcriptional regulator with XRE-family HTH domain
MAMSKSFGERLREERKKQNLTAEMVANACKTSRSYITLIESGKRLPGKKILPKIAIALGIKTTTVLNWYLEDISKKIQRDLKISQRG